MKWWMLCVERRSHKQGGEIHPLLSNIPHSLLRFHPPCPYFSSGIPNCHLPGSQIHIFYFSLPVPPSVFLTSFETSIFHIGLYIYRYYFQAPLCSFLSSAHPFTYLYFLLMFVLFYVYNVFICFTEGFQVL